jgi:hypothetical protein
LILRLLARYSILAMMKLIVGWRGTPMEWKEKQELAKEFDKYTSEFGIAFFQPLCFWPENTEFITFLCTYSNFTLLEIFFMFCTKG